MTEDEIKELIKQYIKDNLTIEISGDTPWADYTTSVVVTAKLADEEICKSSLFIEYPTPRISY